MTVCFAFFALLEVPGIFDGGKGGTANQIFAGAIVAACLAMAIRAAIAFSVSSSEEGVRIRTLSRTRRYAWTDIDRFDVQQRRIGMGGFIRNVLAIRTFGGDQRHFTDVNSSPKDSALIRFVEGLNRKVAASHEPPPTSSTG